MLCKSLERRDLLAQNQQYSELEGANRELREHLRVLEDQQAVVMFSKISRPPHPLSLVITYSNTVLFRHCI